MADINLTQGGILPRAEILLADRNGPVDVTGYTVKYRILQGGTIIANCTCTVIGTGRIRVDWVSGDVDTPGVFEGEVEVDTGSGKWYFPSDRRHVVHIRAAGHA